MARDVCIKANSYCPVCRGIVGVDCWHEASQFHAGSGYLDDLLKARQQLAAALAERERAVKDAERYRWLRGNHRHADNFHELGRLEWYLSRSGCRRGFMSLDDSIDKEIERAAIAAGGEGDRDARG